MSMVIQHNIPALQTYNIVNNTSNSLQKSIQKLSSGLRINSAADDAAGLAISEKMRAQIGGLNQALSNTQDGVSMIQTAEGALNETHSILQHMRELSVQAANDTLTQQDRSYIQSEIDQLNEEITRIGNTTQFNKKKLLNGDAAVLWSSSDADTKAIVNGGLREIDQFGQKKSVEGNYKITVRADPGQGEVQKSDIMKIKHPNVVTDKNINTLRGVEDLTVDNVAAGNYKLTYNSNVNAGQANLTAAYGIGGLLQTTDTTFSVNNSATAPVTKITVMTDDGVEIWSTSGDDIFGTGNNGANQAVQEGYFNGTGATAPGLAGPQTDDAGVEHEYAGVMNEIIAAAKDKGINLSGDFQNGFHTSRVGDDPAPGIKIVYEGGGSTNVSPVAAATVNDPGTPVLQSATQMDVFDFQVNDVEENASILFEVKDIDAVNRSVTLKATAYKMSENGTTSTSVQDDIILSLDTSDAPQGTPVDLNKLLDVPDGGTYATLNLVGRDGFDSIQEGAKFVYSVTANALPSGGTGMAINIDATADSADPDKWDGGPFRGQTVQYQLDQDKVAGTELDFKQFFLNEKTGTVETGTITLKTGKDFKVGTNSDGALALPNPIDDDTVLASGNVAYIGKVATGDTKLRDLDKFWNSEGTFLLDDPKKITLSQGDGKTATVTLYANDTLDDVAKKFNDAIANDLGQGKYVNDSSKFTTFVSGGSKESEAVGGTFLIRSVVPGSDGEITLSGDEAVINAFSLNTIQDAKETTYSVDVSDAHSGAVIAQGLEVTGNVAHGVISPNVDVEFSALGGVNATWNDNLKKFDYSSTSQESILHLSDNTTVFQIGANEGEDMGINIGDMRSHALGTDKVNVMSHDRAARSITIIDNAIDKVSTQRAKLGAYQNRLEYTANNLTTASENMTSAESRIRDADMAKEMMEFSKLQIMLQAGNSMLAQANQLPQNVLSLIR